MIQDCGISEVQQPREVPYQCLPWRGHVEDMMATVYLEGVGAENMSNVPCLTGINVKLHSVNDQLY